MQNHRVAQSVFANELAPAGGPRGRALAAM